MSVCPECFTHDKNFFAGRCHACNSEIGFIRQCLTSLLWTTTYAVVGLGTTFFILWLIIG